MNKRLSIVAALVALSSALAAPAYAEVKTVTLNVSNMTCSLCPVTVKKSLQKVPGVVDAKVSFETKQAVVKFDDAKTSVDALTKATGDAGYPSSLK